MSRYAQKLVSEALDRPSKKKKRRRRNVGNDMNSKLIRMVGVPAPISKKRALTQSPVVPIQDKKKRTPPPTLQHSDESFDRRDRRRKHDTKENQVKIQTYGRNKFRKKRSARKSNSSRLFYRDRKTKSFEDQVWTSGERIGNVRNEFRTPRSIVTSSNDLEDFRESEVSKKKKKKKRKPAEPVIVDLVSSSNEENDVEKEEDIVQRKKSKDNPVVLEYACCDGYCVTVKRKDCARLKDGRMLNDTLIDFYMKYLADQYRESMPTLTSRIFIFSTYFYTKLTEGGFNYENVRRWTKKTNLFRDFNFVFVPINKSGHWSLMVICMMSPYYFMLHLDALRMHDHDQIGHHLMRYLREEWKRLKKDGHFEEISKMPTSLTKHKVESISVPRQRNGYDCGMFVCAYAKKIFEDLQNNFSEWQEEMARRDHNGNPYVNSKLMKNEESGRFWLVMKSLKNNEKARWFSSQHVTNMRSILKQKIFGMSKQQQREKTLVDYNDSVKTTTTTTTTLTTKKVKRIESESDDEKEESEFHLGSHKSKSTTKFSVRNESFEPEKKNKLVYSEEKNIDHDDESTIDCDTSRKGGGGGGEEEEARRRVLEEENKKVDEMHDEIKDNSPRKGGIEEKEEKLNSQKSCDSVIDLVEEDDNDDDFQIIEESPRPTKSKKIVKMDSLITSIMSTPRKSHLNLPIKSHQNDFDNGGDSPLNNNHAVDNSLDAFWTDYLSA